MQDASLPRFAKLDVFNPHRQSFECRHEADVNPPITPQAEALFQQGMAATSHDLWPDERDYKKAAALWKQAADLGHWKAQFNLAGLYLQGLGVEEQSAGRALLLTEDLMRKGVPAAWDNMGAYYMGGIGLLKQDPTVAYAFWQKAADMGSMAAQAYLGAKLMGTYDDPPSFWGNRVIGLKMLECAFEQGSAKAAFSLGADLNGPHPSLGEDYARALTTLHEGVRLGSEDSANYLFSAFKSGDPLVGRLIDKARAERYSILGDALWHNPDLRFPNLDKVLPLPPAQLPKWDGDKKTLIDAAKAVVPAQVIQPTPGAALTGRAHIPDGYVLPLRPVPPSNEATMEDVRRGIWAQYETTSATYSGYWQAQFLEPRNERHAAWDRAQAPLRLARGEAFPRDREAMGLMPGDGRIMWCYRGIPVKRAPPEVDPRVLQGVARYAQLPSPVLVCSGTQACPKTGIWQASVGPEHALAGVFNHWGRQAYVHKGRSFAQLWLPHPRPAPHELRWRWLDNANVQGLGSFEDVTVSDLHDAQGRPLA